MLNSVAEINQMVEVSLNSVAGWNTPKTMKLKGVIREQPVVILIDPGATHNFISSELVERLQIPVTKTESYGVIMGTCSSVKGKGVYRRVIMHVQEIDIVDDFLPLSLGGADVTLGVQWLEKLGTTHTNWKTQIMKFQIGEQNVTLRGDATLG